ncbi:MAG: SpoIIE family protein phosphatase [Oscillospiraceae bacterium]|nr:SpoIIE family protein phosphatase [Oscillospiraceae bacterium]MCL2278892.1 SpoIIE family protein phosphatase [Oscillospiraceae bacterium]
MVIIAVSITMVSLLVLRTNTIDIGVQLGDSAANDSRQALEQAATEQLISMTYSLASMSDAELMLVQNSVQMIAFKASEIVQNPERYTPRPVALPDSVNAGVMTPQLLFAEGLNFDDIAPDAALMGNIQHLLMNIILNNVDATAAYVGTEQGFFIEVSEDSHLAPSHFDPRERPWYRSAVLSRDITWSDVFIDASSGSPGIASAMPFFDRSGNVAGVAGVGTLLDDLTEIVIGTRLGESGHNFILNEMGQIIIAEGISEDEHGNILREDLLHQENAELAMVARRMVDGESGIERIVMYESEVFIAFSPLETLPWSLAVVIEVEEVIAPALESQGRIIDMTDDALTEINIVITVVSIIFVAILFGIIPIISYWSRRFSLRLTNPITELQEGVHDIADGNLDYPIAELDIYTGDEIEDLGLSVCKMTSSLKEYIDNLQKVTAERERIGAELDVATNIQASMLPSIFPPFPDRKEFDIYATMIPAKEVGGDFYDFFLVGEDKLAVVMADVSGKGVPAALFMVIAKTLIKNNAQNGLPPKDVLETVNDILCENNDAAMFVTVFIAVLDIPTGKLTYANAGHNPPLLKRAGGDYEWLPTKRGFVIAGMEGMKYKQEEIELSEGDELYLYTDGVTEAMNPAKELFSDPYLLEVANKYKDENLKEFLGNIKKEIDIFADGAEQADDITMLVLEIKKKEKVG